ncbi:MAG TPA: hypothetical protein VNE63_06525 [Candidatus Acidoferrales bacterium]|nr:hypothetical protein [Candidatus Acidoferrales bacterium]
MRNGRSLTPLRFSAGKNGAALTLRARIVLLPQTAATRRWLAS